MSGEGAPTVEPVDCHDVRVAVLAASWHQEVMDGLVAGARRALDDHRVEGPGVVRVPGSFELPVVAAALAAIGFGLLTCDTEQQALDRAGLPGSSEDKGYEAASAALLTATTLKRVRRRYETD